jgi:hypothetical protein
MDGGDHAALVTALRELLDSRAGTNRRTMGT